MNNPASNARFLFEISGQKQDLSVVHIQAREAMSETFTVQVNLVSMFELKGFDDIVDREAVLTVIGADAEEEGGDRYFHGIVRRFEHTGMNGYDYLYEAEVAPSLWRLSLRKNSRIFQDMETRDIVRQILEEGGIASDRYRFVLRDQDRLRKYCVQSRETDLHFITRLLQEEGIFYYFEHHQDKHILVMSDTDAVHEPIPGDPAITFNSNDGLVAQQESVHAFSFSQRLRPGCYTHRNFNFKHPSLDLTHGRKGKDPGRYEIYDYPALHVTQKRGETLAAVRMEELASSRKQGEGRSSSCRLIPGCTFSLSDHDAESLNRDYLIIEVTHSGSQPQSLEERASGVASYENRFSVIPAETPFRPPLSIEKPEVRGVQTAIVVGPPGEEIYTDRYGRVKVQFHWDREGERNDRSSCWIRPAQGWGGGGWGMVYLPRVGDEVLVDFIEGDPDRPIITGSAYNEANLPLYRLPFNKTVSTIKSRSYPHGGMDNYNELRFEDRKGNEEVYLQGEKDWNILIKNDKGQTVGHDESLRVGNNRDKSVGVDQFVSIGNNHTEVIGANKSINVGANKTEFVTVNTCETIGLARELTIGGLYQVSVGGAMNETVGLAKAEEVGLTKAVLVGSHMSENVVGNRSISVGGNFSTTVTRTSTLKAQAIIFEADDEIVLKSGSSLISMKSNGDIVVSGGAIETKASGENVIKGARISEN
jgi:type VI secretion system secreted protein VgrG